MNLTEDSPFFCSWSGGKDSCLALYQAMQGGGNPAFLLTMLDEDGEKSRGHGLPAGLIERQALLLGIPLASHATTWEGYKEKFLSILGEFKSEGLEVGVFGDIELEAHREWITGVCSSVGVRPCFPLWGKPRQDLAGEWLETGFKAIVVAVREDDLDKSYLGRALDDVLLQEFTDLGIDAFGEDGEYHSVVTDGPTFSSPLVLEAKGEYFKDGHWFLDITCM